MHNKTLVSLNAYNDKRASEYQPVEKLKAKARYNGIACPNCNAQMIDVIPTTILTSIPPKLSVTCPKCGHSSYRIL